MVKVKCLETGEIIEYKESEIFSHRLMCGDSTKKEDIEKLMNNQKANVVYTDPPYGMNLDTDFSDMVGLAKGNKYKAVKGDKEDFTDDLINTVFNNFGYCKEIFLWGADYFAELLPNRNNGSWVVWDKQNNGEGCNDAYDKMFGSNFELCWSKNKHKRALARVLWKGFFGMQNEDTKKRIHPTQKPIELAKWFLEKFSNENDIIVDIYGGSGSTLMCCEQMNRTCYMMEYDAGYIDCIIQRWENFTGKKAVKLN
jgi:DNA modification methylase